MNQVYNISIVVSSYNRDNKVLQTIERLFESDFSNFKKIELIVIDDGSPSSVKELLKNIHNKPDKIDLKIITQKNTGIGGTRNRGYREAAASIILFLDDDILLGKETVKNIFEAQQEKPGAVIFGSYPFISHQSVSLQKFARKLFGYDLITTEKKFEKVDGITSGLLCIDKSKLPNPDFFYKDNLTVPAAEEHEIIYRFHTAGIPIFHAMHISAIHNHHLELGWLGGQQYKYGLATAEAFIKNPEITGMEKFSALKNSLTSAKQGIVKKSIKSFLASKAGRELIFMWARILERLFPNRNHDHIFGMHTSSNFLAGYRDGLKRFAK